MELRSGLLIESAVHALFCTPLKKPSVVLLLSVHHITTLPAHTTDHFSSDRYHQSHRRILHILTAMPIPFYRPSAAPAGALGAAVLPVVTANPLSRLYFHWVSPLMKIGYSRPLEPDGESIEAAELPR